MPILSTTPRRTSRPNITTRMPPIDLNRIPNRNFLQPRLKGVLTRITLKIANEMRRLPSAAALLLIFLLAACARKETADLLQPSQALGTVLAEEAARAAGPKKTVALITPDPSWGPASTVEE